MAGTTPNEVLLRPAYAAWAESKGARLDAWLALFDDTSVFRSLANGAEPLPFTQETRGRDGLRTYLETLTREWEMVSWDTKEFISQGDRVAVVSDICWRNKATGKLFQSPKVDLWRIEHGRAVEFFELYDTAAVAAAAR